MYRKLLLFAQLSVLATATDGDNSKTETQKSFSIKPEEIKREPIMTATDKNFDIITRRGHTFVKFYAPWCGHCLEMAPDWEELGENLRDKPLAGVDLTVAEVDCVANALLCLKQGVDSYPTIKLYHPDGSAEDYLYGRVFDRMKRYLVDKLIDIDQIPTNSIGTVTLNDFTFQKFVDKNKVVVVKFFAHWCPHCISFKDVFDEVVMKFLMEESEDVKFAEIDCMDMESLDACTEEGVEGFPAVYLYKDGMVEDIFTEERTAQNFENFIWSTVDESRVEEEDPFMSLMGMMAGDDFDEDKNEDDDHDDDEEDEEEEEECDCSEKDCDCEDNDEDEDYDDDDDVESEESELEGDESESITDGKTETEETSKSEEDEEKSEEDISTSGSKDEL